LGLHYNATLCYLAHPIFFWRQFLFGAVGAALLFFSFSFKKSINLKEKNKCAAGVLATKTMTKKVGAAIRPGLQCLLMRWRVG
jgi:hypothetical protein